MSPEDSGSLAAKHWSKGKPGDSVQSGRPWSHTIVPAVALLCDLHSAGRCSGSEEWGGHRSSAGALTDAPPPPAGISAWVQICEAKALGL